MATRRARTRVVLSRESVNGVLFTGGEETLATDTPYYQAAKRLFNLTLAANAAGERVPLWGACTSRRRRRCASHAAAFPWTTTPENTRRAARGCCRRCPGRSAAAARAKDDATPSDPH